MNFRKEFGLNKKVACKFLELPCKLDNVAQIEYVWIDAAGELRSKTKTVDFIPKTAEGG
jgi:hypothetical protein